MRSDSKPIAGSETSLRTIRSAPLRDQLLAGAREAALAVLGGEADDRLALALRRREAGEDVLGGLEMDVESRASGA